jgi:hypothetical protein
VSYPPHPLREKIIAHFYAGGRTKNLEGFTQRSGSRFAARYGFKLHYLQESEIAEIMAKRKAKGLIK